MKEETVQTVQKEQIFLQDESDRISCVYAETLKLRVVKRDGMIVPFQKSRIFRAIEAAFLDIRQLSPESFLESGLAEIADRLTDEVIGKILHIDKQGCSITVEGIQNFVEDTLMEHKFHDIARGYIIYREERKKVREGVSDIRLYVYRHDRRTRTSFNAMKVASTMEEIICKSSRSQKLHEDFLLSRDQIILVNDLTQKVCDRIKSEHDRGMILCINELQDVFEEILMSCGLYQEARYYILSRRNVALQLPDLQEDQNKEREGEALSILLKEGGSRSFTEKEIQSRISFACDNLNHVSVKELFEAVKANLYKGMREEDVDTVMIMVARSRIEREPNYSFVAARLLLDKIYRETMNASIEEKSLQEMHRQYFISYIKQAVSLHRLSIDLLDFELEDLSVEMHLERDMLFQYLGLQILYDRYLLMYQTKRLETPQIFWMRVAMGLSIKEKNKTKSAIEFYRVLSQMLYLPGTPTLFNAGTPRPQLSSCYLSFTQDDLQNIFKVISDNALLSKWAGGLGNSWTQVRSLGSWIKGTNGKSRGVIPFLKIVNDTALAVNQGGKRNGAVCVYLETWHLDIEDFLELRKNTGDDRRRTHDMNTANWIPDLFLKRVRENGKWTLFSPSDVSDLHDLYGQAFEKKYVEYEERARRGEIALYKEIDALFLWRKMLSSLFETGYPWLTFKDPANIRSPQDHVGVIHSSNLCTEIFLNTSADETATCNLGSLVLPRFFKNGVLQEEMLKDTIWTAVKMLNNVIDVQFYPIPETANANQRHRPIGLGLMGFQDVLFEKKICYASYEAVELIDYIMETISYYAIFASSELAEKDGPYPSYIGSKWDRGLFPIDTIDLLEKERGMQIDVNRSTRRDWDVLRNRVKKFGLRNSTLTAIAPTATIGNIAGVFPSIDPIYSYLFVKSNLSGNFTILSTVLVEELRKRGLWTREVLDDLKYYDGFLKNCPSIPQDIKDFYLTAFDINPAWVVQCFAHVYKWLDLGAPLIIYMRGSSGKEMSDIYMNAWEMGVKSTYYLKGQGATSIEQSTIDINLKGIQPKWMKSISPSSYIQIRRMTDPKRCDMQEDCEGCQ